MIRCHYDSPDGVLEVRIASTLPVAIDDFMVPSDRWQEAFIQTDGRVFLCFDRDDGSALLGRLPVGATAVQTVKREAPADMRVPGKKMRRLGKLDVELLGVARVVTWG